MNKISISEIFKPSLLGFLSITIFFSAFAEGEDKVTADHFPLDVSEIERVQAPQVTSYADALADVQEAVVAVYTARTVRYRQGVDPREEMLRRLFGYPPSEQQSGEEEERRVPTGQGSGVIVSQDGYILTNNHVISDRSGRKADEVFVTLSDGEELEAEIVGYDEKTDIAVLKVEAEDLPHAVMADSDNLLIGDIVFAIGNPLGVGKTVTMGIVSATSRDLDLLGEQAYESFIQTDASINMGNSGGALVDAQGRLVGINTAIVSQSGGNIGIGFAVPMKIARSILISLATEGEVRRGMLGIYPSRIDANLAESFELESTEGAIVTQVDEDLPAGRAGVEVGDIILEISGEKVRDDEHLRLIVASHPPGTEVNLLILRDGDLINIPVVLGDIENQTAASGSLLDGVYVQNLNEELRSENQIPEEIDGLFITDIESDSPYRRRGSDLREGMVILRINRQEVDSLSQARNALKPGMNRFYIYYRGQFGFIGVPLAP